MIDCFDEMERIHFGVNYGMGRNSMEQLVLIPNRRHAHALIFAGNAYIRIRNSKTGNRFTYRIATPEKPRSREVHFVSVLTGESNTSDYMFLGTIFDLRIYKRSQWRARLGRT